MENKLFLDLLIIEQRIVELNTRLALSHHS